MRTAKWLNGLLPLIPIWLGVFLCLCLIGCSPAAVKRPPSTLPQSCHQRLIPPAELLLIEPEPVARGRDIKAGLDLLEPLRLWGRMCNSRTQAIIDWANSPTE